MDKVYVIFNGEIYEFDNDVNLAGYLERCCDHHEGIGSDNGIFYEDEL